jgi:hypothetical protein
MCGPMVQAFHDTGSLLCAGERGRRNFTALYEKGLLSSNGCYHTRRWSKTP